MSFGLRDHIIARVNGVFTKYPQIDKVIVYGSRAKGNYRNGSDIDLTLVGDDLTLKLLNKIELEIDDLMLPYTFDMSLYNDISNPDLIDHINRVGMVFYKPDNFF